MVGCPQCGTPIQPTWDWCEACGFDPEGLKPAGWRPPVAAHERPATAPQPATPPPGFGAAPPGARPPGPTTAGGYAAGGFPAPPFAPPPGGAYPPAMYGSPPPQGSGGGGAGTVIRVLLAVGVGFVLLVVVLIGAVTLLGKNASTKFSRIDTAIDDPAAPTTAPDWKAWSAPDGTFTVDLPGKPLVTSVPPSAGLQAGQQVQANVGTTDYVVVFLDFSPTLSFPDPVKVLTGGIEGAGKTVDMTVAKATPSTFAGITSVEATMAATPGAKAARSGRARAFIVDHRMYLLLAISPTGATDFDRFAGSFHVN